MTIGIWGLDRDNLYVIFDLRDKFFEGGFSGDGRIYPCFVHGIVLIVQFPVLCLEMIHDVNSRYIGVCRVSLLQGFVVYLVYMTLDDLLDCCVDGILLCEVPDNLFLCEVNSRNLWSSCNGGNGGVRYNIYRFSEGGGAYSGKQGGIHARSKETDCATSEF